MKTIRMQEEKKGSAFLGKVYFLTFSLSNLYAKRNLKFYECDFQHSSPALSFLINFGKKKFQSINLTF